MIAQSQSGTGKTAAFVLAMLSRVDTSLKFPQVVRQTFGTDTRYSVDSLLDMVPIT